MAQTTSTILSFNDLEGWAADDHQAALDVFLTTCDDPVMWRAEAQSAESARDFFETAFQPVLITDGNPPLFTGYFEPELYGSRQQEGPFQHPIYRVPDDLTVDEPYLTRREIEEGQPLAGRGLELAWLADPVDLFFLQVQGSGRLQLPDGAMMRVGFAAKNGHPYTSIGKVLIDRGVCAPDEVSPALIRNWIATDGAAGQALMWENQSYVFFREIDEVDAALGPLGTMNRPVTAGRSIAVDPDIVPLGAPVWIETISASPYRRLMVAQDTGSAIKGAQRADIFCGTGDAAGVAAGKINDTGRMVVLMPRATGAS